MSSTNDFNDLKKEQSAYLRQHAQNPVRWLPFGEKALRMAKEENRPILISIGYSSCHWCHVMAEESFEDPETAKFLNENFIPVKVDREEMPDLDQYGQMICQLMNGRGGWPLNLFMTPDMEPFYAGTYFPKTGRQNMPSFMDVLQSLSKACKDDQKTVSSNAKQLMEAAKTPPKAKEKIEYPGRFPAAAGILNAVKTLADETNGGYGKAPKFPQFSFYEFALEQILEGMIPEELGRHIVLSLEKMLLGGVYDHARGGLHRYSVDEQWLVPHFEKMLNDQAGLLSVLSKLSLIYPSPLVLDAIKQTLTYLQKEMLSDDGRFFSAQDADSEGMEGLYFTFTLDEFKDAVSKSSEEAAERLDEIVSWFRISEEGNFGQGLNVIALEPAKKDELYRPENWKLVREVKTALLEERKGRIPPMTDNKGVASWNFMLLSSLVDVVQYSKIEDLKSAASELLKASVEGVHKAFLIQGAENEKSGIRTATTKEESSVLFEDFVSFARSQLRLYEISGNETFKNNGIETLLHIKEAFCKDGVFYTRAVNDEKSKAFDNIPAPVFDQSSPAPVGTYLFLTRKWSLESEALAKVFGEMEETVETLKDVCLSNPLGFGEMLRAMIYPDEAFKKIKIPLHWLKENKIQALFPNFSARFALVYSEDNKDGWEICNHQACEMKGESFEEFLKVFTPSKDSGQATEESPQ